MANAKEIKERIASIEETRKITNAMYLISSSKMQQAKEKLAKTEPFFFAIQEEISRILCYWPEIENKFFDQRKAILKNQRKIGIIAITSDKGLAGAYNHNIIKEVENLINQGGIDKLFMIGESGRYHFSKSHKDELDLDFHYTVQNPTLHRSRLITNKIINLFLSGELDEVHIIYTKVKNAVSSETDHMKLLPLQKGTFNQYCDVHFAKGSVNFYPSPGAVMDSIVPSYINGIIYGALVESYCSEHSSRMMAMQNATDSADDMLSQLNMTYNRVRQANITQELTEVVAGANAQQRK